MNFRKTLCYKACVTRSSEFGRAFANVLRRPRQLAPAVRGERRPGNEEPGGCGRMRGCSRMRGGPERSAQHHGQRHRERAPACGPAAVARSSGSEILALPLRFGSRLHCPCRGTSGGRAIFSVFYVTVSCACCVSLFCLPLARQRETRALP